jgi:cobalt-zinc-cadmium efflux system outer membrane protein
MIALIEQRALVEKAIETRKQIVTMVGKRVSGGASTKLDLSVAELAVTQAERDRDNLEANEIAAAAALGVLMGTAPPRGAAGTVPDDASPPAEFDPLVEAALASRPALAAQEHRFQQREQTLRAEHARAWPWIRLTAAPRYRLNVSDDRVNDFSAGIRLSVPLLNQNDGPIKVAEATRDQERELFRKQVVAVRQDLESARAVIKLRAETLRRYQTQVLPGLDEQERLLGLSISGGQLDVVALLQASELILRSRREYVDVRLACYRARLDLERAVGRRLGAGSSAP